MVQVINGSSYRFSKAIGSLLHNPKGKQKIACRWGWARRLWKSPSWAVTDPEHAAKSADSATSCWECASCNIYHKIWIWFCYTLCCLDHDIIFCVIKSWFSVLLHWHWAIISTWGRVKCIAVLHRGFKLACMISTVPMEFWSTWVKSVHNS